MAPDGALYDLNPLYYTPGSKSEEESEYEFLGLYTQLNSSELLRLAHQPSTFIQECKIGVFQDERSSECDDLITVGSSMNRARFWVKKKRTFPFLSTKFVSRFNLTHPLV